jgi:hypothetical protein
LIENIQAQSIQLALTSKAGKLAEMTENGEGAVSKDEPNSLNVIKRVDWPTSTFRLLISCEGDIDCQKGYRCPIVK